MSLRQQQISRRGEKKQYRGPGRPGGATSAQLQKLYKRVGPTIRDDDGDSSFSASSTTTNEDLGFKKPDGQGEHSSVKPETTANTKSESFAAQSYGPSESSVSEASIIPTDSSSQENYPTPLKDLSSELASGTMESAASTTTIRDDTKGEVSLQFGSFHAGFANGMQVPARTSSAPPNMDEQKKKQADLGSFNPEKIVHASSGLSQSQPGDSLKQTKIETTVRPQSKSNMHSHLPAASFVTGTISSSCPSSGMPMTIPFQQPHIPIQFGIPSPQIQTPGIASTSLQMPMPLPVGYPRQVQQAAFAPGLHPHPLHPHGLMHQGQGFNFFSQIGHQLGSPFGSSHFGVSPRFAQQNVRNPTPRRAVKITHPKTHEELKLDEMADNKLDYGSRGPVSHRNVGFQMHPIAYELPYPMNYFSNVHPGPVFLQGPTSVPSAFNSSGMLGIVSSNKELATPAASVIPATSSTSIPMTVKSDSSPNVKKIFPSSSSLNSVVYEKNRANRISSPPSIVHSREEPKIHPEQSVELSKTVPGPVSPDKSPGANEESFAALPSVSPVGKSSKWMIRLDTVNNQLKMPAKEDIQAESSTKASAAIYDCACEASDALKEVEPSISNSEVGHNTFSAAGLEMECQAATTSKETYGGNPVTIEAPLPTSDVYQGLLEVGESSNEAPGRSSIRVCMDHKMAYGGKNGENNSSGDPSQQLYPVKVNDGLNSETSVCKELATPTIEIKVREGQSTRDSLKTNKAHRSLSESSSFEVAVSSLVSPINQSVVKSMKGVVSGGGHGPTHDEEVIPSANGKKISSKSEFKNKETFYRVKSATSRGKKKRKEVLQKADAAGATSDLYMAFKGSREKPESAISSESVGSAFSISPKHILSSSNDGGIAAKEDGGKTESDDWENATEISIPKVEIPNKTKVVQLDLRNSEEVAIGPGKKRYSRDFLLTLSGQFTDLPSGFTISYDLLEALMDSKASIEIGVDCDLSYNSGHSMQRPYGVFLPDYYGSGPFDDSRSVDHGRWNKSAAPFVPGLGQHVEISHRGHTFGFRPVQGGNYGRFRNLHAQTPGQYVGEPHLTLQGGIQYNGPVVDRWQRVTRYQKFFSPVQSPLLVMHKAEKKYEVHKVTDAEEAKQRHLKAILNKLTPQNFDRLFHQVKEVNIETAVTLFGVISQIFDKALMEPTFCEMYASFCYRLAGELPDFVEDNQKITFKRLLLNKCQDEFERHEREQAEADEEEGDGEDKQSEEEREEKRIQSRRRMLGNIRLIGELYKKKMLTERIMHECIHKLLGQYQNPDEEDIEALCNLMCTIGEIIDHPKAKQHMDAYFEIMMSLSNNMNLSSRLRFMLKDVTDLRKNKWQQRRKIEGPKKIEELRRDVAQERQASRTSRSHSFTSSVRRGQPADFGPQPSTVFSQPSVQMGAFHGMPSQTRGPGRGLPMLSGPMHYANRDLNISGHSSAKPVATSRPAHIKDAVTSNISSEKAWSEEHLSELSMAAIREFYRARDENEVVLCVKDLNAPSFYPAMISLWVTDSFERKDRDRDLLSRLLVNLMKRTEGILNINQLAEGLQSVVATLEDAVTDAPKAAAYLGYIFGRIIIEKVISLAEIAHLLRKAGREPGHLMKNGLAYEVVQTAFEMIRSEKGESGLEEICRSSNIWLEDFESSGANK